MSNLWCQHGLEAIHWGLLGMVPFAWFHPPGNATDALLKKSWMLKKVPTKSALKSDLFWFYALKNIFLIWTADAGFDAMEHPRDDFQILSRNGCKLGSVQCEV